MSIDNGQLTIMNQIEHKSFSFSVRVVKLARHLQDNRKEFILTKQLIRSGTSIGANVVEAQQAQSRADFISKLNIALKEAVETNYWIRLLKETEYLSNQEFDSIISDCRELEKLLTAIIKSTRNSQPKSR